MKTFNSNRHAFSAPATTTRFAGKAQLSVISLAVLLSACGGGGSDNSNPGNPNQGTVTPILQVGMQRQFVGATTRTVVYTNPTITAPNNSLSYTFVENQSVLQAAAGAPGNFDINSMYSYTVTQDPGVGSVPVSQTVDDYRNLTISGTNQYTVDLGQNSTAVSNDETANALGGGPYTETTSTTQVYPTARASLTYPLVTGATNTIPQSYVQTVNFTDVNASNVAPPSGNNYAYARDRTDNNDGSFFYKQTGASGINETYTQNSDGSGVSTSLNTNTNITTTNTISTPLLASGAYTIPVNVTLSGGASSSTDYSAFDWYPGNVLTNPLILETQTVVGPATALPTACNGALVQPDVVEVDTSTTSLNTIGGSYSVTATQAFNSNGVSVCTLTQQTTTSYNVKTGAVNATTSTQTTSLLNAIN